MASLLLFSLLFPPLTLSIQLNIHVKVFSPYNATISTSNQALTSSLSNPPDQKIDFETLHDPHATLYLTTFRDEEVDNIVEKAAVALKEAYGVFCIGGEGMEIGQTKNAQGSYGMLGVTLTPCLQGLSDSLVNATSPYLDPSATQYIPSWVYNLPEDEKEEKINLIHKYGSPNVFSGFQPHVTLVGDSLSSDDMKAMFDATEFEPLITPVGEVGLGKVGEFGTVLKGKDVAGPVVVWKEQETEIL